MTLISMTGYILPSLLLQLVLIFVQNLLRVVMRRQEAHIVHLSPPPLLGLQQARAGFEKGVESR